MLGQRRRRWANIETAIITHIEQLSILCMSIYCQCVSPTSHFVFIDNSPKLIRSLKIHREPPIVFIRRAVAEKC